jgi:hypothetical protein
MQEAWSLERVIDRLAIHDVIARYARGVDRMDWDMVKSTYHPDAVDDHGDYQGGVDGFVEWTANRHAKIEVGRHFLGNMLIEFANDDTALVETYFVALKRFRQDANRDISSLKAHERSSSDGAARAMLNRGDLGPNDAVDIESFARYIDRMEKRDGEWRIAKRSVVFDFVRITAAPAFPGTEIKPSWSRSQRNDGDPLLAARRELGLA